MELTILVPRMINTFCDAEANYKVAANGWKNRSTEIEIG